MGAPMTIEGYDVVVAEDMPNIGANTFPVAFGDFNRGYLIADRAGMQLIRDEVTKPGYVRYQVFKRVGGKLKDTSAIKLIKVAST
jgi:HK97 family phage major capsid protein